MKLLYLMALSLLVLVISCNSTNFTKASSATEAGREFVDAILDGNHDKAFFYLLKDSTNELLFEQQKSNYHQLSNSDKKNYEESSIVVIDIKPESDSVNIFRYYHSANPKDTTPLRVVKKQEEWLVDLKSVIKM
ncbi:MAG: hypothetical protein H7Y31_15275 [Chitinophagaceae bacterium]|nr:hypothetical protein [Chitinophagaceae bacterium]